MNRKILFLFILVVMILFLVTACNEYQRSQICGTHTEKYTSSVKGCDGIQGCTCLHQAWLGLGGCDSCECTKQVSDC